MDGVEQQLAESIPDPAALESVDGALAVAKDALDLDVMRVLMSHSPDTYIAWMQTVDPDENLTFER